jgi:hypothetical protein
MPRSTKKQAQGFLLNGDLPGVDDSDFMQTGPRDIIPADLAAELGLPPGTPLGMLDDGNTGDDTPPTARRTSPAASLPAEALALPPPREELLLEPYVRRPAS